jgi:flagellar biosynthesis/type III secretory pathway protein FliH
VSAFPEDFAKLVEEKARENMEIYAAGHKEGYRLGYADAIAKCQTIIKATFGEKLPDDVQ